MNFKLEPKGFAVQYDLSNRSLDINRHKLVFHHFFAMSGNKCFSTKNPCTDVNFNGSIISDLNLSHLFCISCENDSAKMFEFLNLSEPK